ncbi:hypothetical protein E2C01_088114 [Portunus trituberculatus]|uniref:Uncharacterized protein n=1 Tax=Portunus trituberculatus TaxID=210409 RepID=A0A5B7JDM1_PORTR|nr:hypothetical protein [Portunus trituberculatus]
MSACGPEALQGSNSGSVRVNHSCFTSPACSHLLRPAPPRPASPRFAQRPECVHCPLLRKKRVCIAEMWTRISREGVHVWMGV